MAVALLLVMIAAVTAAVVYWCSVEERADAGTDPGTAAHDVPAQPESLEGVLVARLMAAAITRRQYLHAMGRVAARDDLRHPLAVPPETGSAEV
jgi:hypothetical protein